MSYSVRIHNLGAIEEGVFELRPLTFFARHNHTAERPMPHADLSHELHQTVATYDGRSAQFAERFASADVRHLMGDFISRLPRHGPVLDAGCGTGRDMSMFSELGIEAWGCDLSSGLLDIAKQHAIPEMLVKCDMRNVPCSDNFFAGVWAMASMVHMAYEEALTAFSEFRRILAPDGIVLTTFKSGDGGHTEWRDGRWFMFWDIAMASRLMDDVQFQPISIELDDGSVGGPWINVIASAKSLE